MGVHRLYIDSRFKVNGTDGSFLYELPETVDLPRGTVAYLSEFCCSASWDTIGEGRNDRFYVVEDTGQARIVTIPAGAYDSETLRVALESGLNSDKTVAGTYSVVRTSSGGTTATASLGSATTL
jgi:hypothetical protein